MQEQNQLDQLISIINNHNNPNNPICHNQQKILLPPIQKKQKPKIPNTSILSHIPMPKYLTFKPWSGVTQGTTELAGSTGNGDVIIKEEIENEEDQQYQGHYEGEREDFMDESKLISNMGGAGEIGYFYRFNTGKVKLIKCLLDENGFRDCHFNSKNWTLFWSSSPFKMDVYRALLPYQKVNHFPNSFHLTRKDLMNKTVSKMQVKYGITHYSFLPKTYILPQELDQLLAEYTKHPDSQTYIVKPHNRSQGKGITVTSSLQTIYSKLQKYSSLIVSHYISNPLLINKLKFDLRIYVAITGVNPLRIYVYEEGLARFATEEYDSSAYDSENKKYQHLTNYSVNKKNADFVASNNQNQEYYGSKWSLTAMRDFLAYNVGRVETNQLFDRIDDVIVKTILSAQNLLYTSFQNNVSYINSCFQVLGFDIMIDSNLKPWLIEVNHSPSMNTDSTLDLKIKGNMIADLFTMTGVTPLNERYLDGGHLKYESRHYFNGDNGNGRGAVDKFIVREVEAEYERRGAWRRVFPSIKNLKFKTYFETDRYFNKLLRQKILTSEQPPKNDQNLASQYRSHTVGKTNSNSNSNNNNGPPGQNKPSIIRLNKVVRRTIIRGSSQRIADMSLL